MIQLNNYNIDINNIHITVKLTSYSQDLINKKMCQCCKNCFCGSCNNCASYNNCGSCEGYCCDQCCNTCCKPCNNCCNNNQCCGDGCRIIFDSFCNEDFCNLLGSILRIFICDCDCDGGDCDCDCDCDCGDCD